MGVFDEIKKAVDQHEEQIEAAIDQAADFVDEKTEGKFAEQVDQAQGFLKDKIGEPES
ncbi:MAG: antitoxin [Propioniciclava sp.]|uniref:antitoxin n=1 Tax=Propioniciclava sp. TaxID=2038686 RepID=UPI0039E2C244